MDHFIQHSDQLIRALATRVEAEVPGADLVSVQFEPLEPVATGTVETQLRVLKTSPRNCFIQGTLLLSGSPVLKARAIFRKK